MKIKSLLFQIILLGAAVSSFSKTPALTKAGKIETFEIENVFNWIDNSSSFFDENGAHGLRKANSGDLFSNGIGLKQQLNVENQKAITVTFQIPDYDHSTRNLIQNHVPNTKIENGASEDRPYDIYLLNVNTGFYAIYRLWSGNSSIIGENSSYIQFCETKTSPWETYEGGDVSGVFTNGSSFTLSFDTKNYLSIKCDWKEEGEQMVPFHDLGNIGSKKTQYLDFMKANFSKAQEIEFWFAHQKLEENTYNEVVVQEINGQSLKVIDNEFDDIIAPIVAPIHESSNDAKYEIGAEYTLRLEKYYLDPSTKADFYVRPSSDATCSIDTLINNSKLLGKLTSNENWEELGEIDTSSSLIKKIVFNKEGLWDLKLEVKDEARNIAYSPLYNIKVIKGYSIQLMGEVPSTAKTNQEIILPKAIASDASGIEREVTITVEDSLGNILPVNDYKFTPKTVGIHYVVYSSSYVENGITYKANKVEREIIVTKGEDAPINDNKDNYNSTLIIALSVTGSILVVATCSFFVIKAILKKRKGNK